VSDLTSIGRELERIARQAGAIAVDARRSLEHELKPDGSIVTNADRLVEKFLRRELPALAEGAGIWGEEFGYEAEGPGGLWVVDPIDGTSNFTFGSPLWGVSIGLIRGDEIVVGAVNLPELDELYLATKGGGATRNGEALDEIPAGHVRPEHLVSFSDGLLLRYKDQLPGKMRYTGAFVVDACFTAVQRYRGMICRREKLYDMAASVLICQEVGAEVRYASGAPLEIDDLKRDEKIRHPWLIFPPGNNFYLED
jgi:fructose-1,6-bisphosphatase/inositol monophosphatase family enzyme